MKPFLNSPVYFPDLELSSPVPLGFPSTISPVYFKCFCSSPLSNQPILPLTFLLLFLAYNLAALEKGTLYLKKVNGKIGWFVSGDERKHLKYIGEVVDGKPNGKGELSSPSGKYYGEFKNGLMNGQVTHTYKNGKKRIGEFRKGKPWNVKSYDKNGFIENEWKNGKKLKFESGTPSFRLRLLYGAYAVETATSSNTSIAFVWNGWGLGQTNENYLDERSGETLDFQTRYLELSYTFDLSQIVLSLIHI